VEALGSQASSKTDARQENLLGGCAEAAALLRSAAHANDVPRLQMLLKAGADASSSGGGYDGRTALHVAAAEGNLEAAVLLVEAGGADVGAQDRWGRGALQEAQRSPGAAKVLGYLQARAGAGSQQQQQQQQQ
jgi:glutaminase